MDRILTALREELADLDRDIDDRINGSPAWREVENLITSVPGIGPITARTLIAELPELGRIDRRRVAALAAIRKSLTILNAIIRDARPWQNA